MLKGISKSCVALMFSNSNVYSEELDVINAELLTYMTLHASKCNFQAIASGLGRYFWEKDVYNKCLCDKGVYCRDARIVNILHDMGANSAEAFASLGMDCIDLNEIAWLERLIVLFGKAEVVRAFLKTPSDAERLSATIACRILDVNLEQLLAVCSGSPSNAYNILKLYDPRTSIEKLHNIQTLFDTGLNREQMQQLGISRLSLMTHNSATIQQIDTMGPIIPSLS